VVKNILVVVTSPVAGREAEYNRWYTDVHLADVLRVPGFTAAQRFKLGANGPSGLPGSYLAIYEYETESDGAELQSAFDVLAKATQSGSMFISSAMDPVKISASIYAPITERLVRAAP
jgi:hypothetical protein